MSVSFIWSSSAVPHVANIILGLAIGAVAGHWLVAFASSWLRPSWPSMACERGETPSVIMVVISLIALALTSGGGGRLGRRRRSRGGG